MHAAARHLYLGAHGSGFGLGLGLGLGRVRERGRGAWGVGHGATGEGESESEGEGEGEGAAVAICTLVRTAVALWLAAKRKSCVNTSVFGSVAAPRRLGETTMLPTRSQPAVPRAYSSGVQQYVVGAPLAEGTPTSDRCAAWKTKTWMRPGRSALTRLICRSMLTLDTPALPGLPRAGASRGVHIPTRRYWITFGSMAWSSYRYTLPATSTPVRSPTSESHTNGSRAGSDQKLSGITRLCLASGYPGAARSLKLLKFALYVPPGGALCLFLRRTAIPQAVKALTNVTSPREIRLILPRRFTTRPVAFGGQVPPWNAVAGVRLSSSTHNLPPIRHGCIPRPHERPGARDDALAPAHRRCMELESSYAARSQPMDAGLCPSDAS